jgi:hypothetical protein
MDHGYNMADENELRWFAATPTNPPIAPFAKGGGPQDRGIFVSGQEFYERNWRWLTALS